MCKRQEQIGNKTAQGQNSVFVAMRQQLGKRGEGGGREREKNRRIKKTPMNFYLPTLKEVESCTDIGDPVDPL